MNQPTCVGCPEKATDLVKCVNQDCQQQLCPECSAVDEGRCPVHSFKGKVAMHPDIWTETPVGR
jgi:hypothetical protein